MLHQQYVLQKTDTYGHFAVRSGRDGEHCLQRRGEERGTVSTEIYKTQRMMEESLRVSHCVDVLTPFGQLNIPGRPGSPGGPGGP